MIFEAVAYPLGKILGAGLSYFETWNEKKKTEITEMVKQNDHIRELELMEKHALLQRELEAIKTDGQIKIAEEVSNQEEMKQLAAIAVSDNEVKKQILQHAPDWSTHAMSVIRILFGVVGGMLFFYVGILSANLLFYLIKSKEFTTLNERLVNEFIETYQIFYHSTVSLVLTYVGVTHTNKRLGGNPK